MQSTFALCAGQASCSYAAVEQRRATCMKPAASSASCMMPLQGCALTALRPCGIRRQTGSCRSRCLTIVRASGEDGSPKKSTEFGYSRKDILLIGAGLIGLGYAMYYGLQATGMEPNQAGNVVQITIFLGICVGYISTYIFRVANKDMTYVKQLEDYEEAVMAKRLAEMPPDELDRLMDEVEKESAEREDKRRRFLEAAAQEKANRK